VFFSAVVTPVVSGIRVVAMMSASSTVLHFVTSTILQLKSSIVVVALNTAAFLVHFLTSKTRAPIIFFVVNIHLFRGCAPSGNLQAVSSPRKGTRVFFEPSGAVQKRGKIKHVFDVFYPLRLDVTAFSNLFQLLQDPKSSVV